MVEWEADDGLMDVIAYSHQDQTALIHFDVTACLREE